METPVNPTISVYEFQDPREYLNAIYADKKKRNRSFSMRSWSRQIGFPSHSSLSFVLTGRRPLRSEHAAAISRALGLDSQAQTYLMALVQLKRCRLPAEREAMARLLERMHPTGSASFLDVEAFRLVADWQHMAILEMTQLRGFKAEPEWISRRLGARISPSQAGDAWNRLVKLGLVLEQREQKPATGPRPARGRARYVKNHARLTTPIDAAGAGAAAIRSHHAQILELATAALHTQSTDERAFNACTLTIKAGVLPRVKEKILQFREEIERLCALEDPHAARSGDETYELSVGFFRLTDPEAPTKKKDPTP